MTYNQLIIIIIIIIIINDINTMNSSNRIAATLFPRDVVCLRNVSTNTLHKGDDDDGNNNNNNNNGERRAHKTRATENSLYNTISIIHNGYWFK